MSIFKEYYSYHEKYTKEFGNDTIVLMQCGKFYETYALGDKGPDLDFVSEVFDSRRTSKNSNKPISEKNPELVGFTTVALEGRLFKAVNGYNLTVVVINEITPPPGCKHGVARIESPSTMTDYQKGSDANYAMSIFLDEEAQSGNRVELCCGMAAMECSTGESIVHEAYSTDGDDKLSLDEAVRFIKSYNPSEVILSIRRNKVNTDPVNKMTTDQIIAYLELDDTKCQVRTIIDKHFVRPKLQAKVLEEIFTNRGIGDVVDYVGMGSKPYALISYLIILDFVKKHAYDHKYLENIDVPKTFDDHSNLVLGNDAVHQLDIVPMYQKRRHKRFNSLFDVVNQTSTAIGSRRLRSQLIHPSVEVKYLDQRYDAIETIVEDELINEIEEPLSKMADFERLQRRLMIQSLSPRDFVTLFHSYTKIEELIKFILKKKELQPFMMDKKMIKSLGALVEESKRVFDLKEMEKSILTDISGSFFKKGVYPDLDEQQREVNEMDSFMDDLCVKLSDMISDKKKKNANDPKVYLKSTETQGHYISLTELRSKALKKELDGLNILGIDGYKMTVDPREFRFGTPSKKKVKLTIPELDDISTKIVKKRASICKQVKKLYIDHLKDLSTKFGEVMNSMTRMVGEIDTIKSAAKTAQTYRYCRPQINHDHTDGFIEAKSIRHPIVERLNEEVEYIPCDVELGTGELDGMLIYGLNSSGKSTLMKSIGIAVVMAQAGMFVPATRFAYFPYRSIFARITGNDNLFRGYSSFIQEMIELRSILRRGKPGTLVIGDEICRGTEHISGNAIVAASIMKLADAGCQFIFATHLHEVAEMQKIRDLDNVKPFHLTVAEIDGELVFDRQLKPGTGERIYGVTVAKFVIDDKPFIDSCIEIKNELMDEPINLTTGRTSKYNKQVLVDKCQICSKTGGTGKDDKVPLDTHHINHQKDCTEGYVNKPGKTHLRKNASANLVILCKSCHSKAHDGRLEIRGYLDTSNGRKLDYSVVKRNKKKSEKPKRIKSL